MNQTIINPKRLLFVSANDSVLSRLVESCFTNEAQKMDLNWDASAATLVESFGTNNVSRKLAAALGDELSSDNGDIPVVTINDLSDCDLVVLLETPGVGCADFSKRFPKWKGQAESWKIPDSEDPLQNVQTLISKLVVTLILKGGKRAPFLPEAPPPSTTRSSSPGQAGTAKVSLDAKGRKGKKVTTVSALTLNESELEKLCAELKQLCGSGGTVKEGVIEIQGDQRERILSELQKRGYKAKRSGG